MVQKNADIVHLVRAGYVTVCGARVDAVTTPRTTRYPALVTCPRCLDRFTLDELQATDPNNEPEGV